MAVEHVSGDDADDRRVGRPNRPGEQRQGDELVAGVPGRSGDEVDGDPADRDEAGRDDVERASPRKALPGEANGDLPLSFAQKANALDVVSVPDAERELIAEDRSQRSGEDEQVNVGAVPLNDEGAQGNDQGLRRENRKEAVDHAEDEQKEQSPQRGPKFQDPALNGVKQIHVVLSAGKIAAIRWTTLTPGNGGTREQFSPRKRPSRG